MNNTIKLVSAAILALTFNVGAHAAAKPTASVDNLGIVTPEVANSARTIYNYEIFAKTGEFAICDDYRNRYKCDPGVYLTPERYVTKYYPSATYVGFKLVSVGTNEVLHLYMKVPK